MFGNAQPNVVPRPCGAPGRYSRPGLDYGSGARARHCQHGICCRHIGDRRLGQRLFSLPGPRRLQGRRHTHLTTPHEG